MKYSRPILSWIFIYLFLFSANQVIGQDFEYVGFGASFNNVDISGNTAVAVGNGVIVYSEDKGQSWKLATFPTTPSLILNDVDMISPLVGWANGANGLILKTIDGGKTWSKQSVPTIASNSVLRGIHAVNENVIFAVGESVTTATGLTPVQRGGIGSISIGSPFPRYTTFTPIPDGLYLNLPISSTPFVAGITSAIATVQVTGGVPTSITITNSGAGYTVGQQVFISRNQFPGSTANLASASPLFTVTGLSSPTPSPFVNKHIILKSIDGGATWTSLLDTNLPPGISHMSTGQFYDVKFLDENIGYVVGRSGTNTFDGGGGKILKTVDGGNTWMVTTLYDDIDRLISAPTTNLASVFFRSLALFDPNIIYAAGSNRLLYKSIDGGISWTLMQSSIKSISGITGLSHEWGNIYGCHPDTLIIANQSASIITDYSAIVTENGGVNFTRKRVSLPNNGFVGPNQIAGEDNCVIMVGAGGRISLSSNKGQTFSPIAENRVVGNRGIFFPSKMIGYSFGLDGVVYKTVDGGLNWINPIFNNGTAGNLSTTFEAAWFFDDNNGIIVGSENSGVKMTTTNDGGVTWIDVSSKIVNANLFDIYFNSPSVGWAVGNSLTTSVVYKTIDGGVSWSLVNNIPFTPTTLDQARTVYFTDQQTGFIGGRSGRLYKTTDGGANWVNLDLTNDFTGGNFNLNDVWFVDANKGFVVGTNGIFAYTSNGGLNWDSTAIYNPTTGIRETSTINKMEWLNANEGYLVGAGGFHYYTTDGGVKFTRFTPNTQDAFSISSNPSWPYKVNSASLPCNLFVAYDNGIIGAQAENYFQDNDGDGLGDGTKPSILSFVPIDGYVNNDRDCDDTDSKILSIPVGNMICIDKVNISLDTTCFKKITPEMMLISNEACIANFKISIAGLQTDLITSVGTYQVTVREINSGNSCWGTILVEDKLAPRISCLDTMIVSCLEPVSISAPKVLDCSNFTLEKALELGKENCATRDTIISYTAIDEYGNMSLPCRQVIKVLPINIDSIKLPHPSVIVPACIAELTPSFISSVTNDTFAYPTIFVNGNRLPISKTQACNIFVNYKDVVSNLCGDSCNGGKKVIRTWTIKDWCSNSIIEHTQIIKAVDITSPTFTTINVTTNANLWKCNGEYIVKRPSDLADNCGGNPTWSVKSKDGIVITGNSADGYKLSGLQKGINNFTILAEDCCGNVASQQGTITIIDNIAPVAVLKEKLVLALITDSTEDENDRGEGKLFAKDVDNGSYDNCGPIKIEIRRPLGAPRCDNIGNSNRNNNITFNNNGSGNDVTTWAHPDDHNSDTDNGEFVKFCCEDLSEQYQQVIIRVWDDGNSNGIPGDNLILNGLRDNYSESWADVKIELKSKPILTCPQNLTVNCGSDLSISKILKTATSLNLPTGNATLSVTCGGEALRYIDDVVETSCGIQSIDRTFLGINSGDTLRCIQRISIQNQSKLVVEKLDPAPINIDRCNISKEDFGNNGFLRNFKPKVLSNPCDLIAENIEVQDYEIENGVCKKWLATFTYLNWCTGEKASTIGYFVYRDTITPVLTSQDQMFEVNSISNNCSGNAVLTAKATDVNICTNDAWLKWNIAIDLNSDGSIDKNFSSSFPLAHPSYIKPTANGEIISVEVSNILNSPSKHTVIWSVTDGCGNIVKDTSTFMVIDKKAPTPYCINLSTAYMKNCTVELWAKDFDKGAYDNCTQSNELRFTFNNDHPVLNKINQIHYFKGQGIESSLAEYQKGDAQKWVPESRTAGKLFDADDFQDSILLITVWDNNLNHEFCKVNLKIINNQVGCLIDLKGEVLTKNNNVIKPIEIAIDAEFSGYSNKFIGDGLFTMTNMENDNYSVTASKVDDYINGVSTIDLVMIQRHILAVKKIEDDYNLLAADVTGDGKINAADLVEIRKLILGVTSKFANQGSWTFIPKNYKFGEANPDAIKNGVIVKANNIDKTAKLIGIKVGDVNNDVVINKLDIKQAEPRSIKRLSLDNQYVKKGENFELKIQATDDFTFLGLQSRLKVNFEIINITSPFQNLDFHKANNELSLTLADGKENKILKDDLIYTIYGKAIKNGYLSEMIDWNIYPEFSEIYVSELATHPMEYIFDESYEGSIKVSQNEPNPFDNITEIMVTLPSINKFDFTITDATGKILLNKEIYGIKGRNNLSILRSELGISSGILFYQIKSDKETITKKMILSN
jgi:photosystem II stability/assembly factor-like uncharacterized protein